MGSQLWRLRIAELDEDEEAEARRASKCRTAPEDKNIREMFEAYWHPRKCLVQLRQTKEYIGEKRKRNGRNYESEMIEIHRRTGRKLFILQVFCA